MPRRGGHLTPMERVFVKHLASTNDATYAAAKAGFSAPAKQGSELAHKPQLVAEAQRLALADLTGKILPLAVKRHMAMLNDNGVTGQTLNRAIEMAYKYGLAIDNGAAGKEPHEMTAEELAQAIDALKRAAMDQAKPVLELKAETVFD